MIIRGQELSEILKKASQSARDKAKEAGAPLYYVSNGKYIKEDADGKKHILREFHEAENTEAQGQEVTEQSLLNEIESVHEETRNEPRETHTYKLKNGDVIIFKTNMPVGEVKSLPIFQSQHKFNEHFKTIGYQLEIQIIMKL